MIPVQLQNPNIRFVLLGKPFVWLNVGSKTKKTFAPQEYASINQKEWKPLGKAPFEQGWQKKMYAFNDARLLEHIKTNNFGVIGGCGRLRIRDIDDPKFAESILQNLDTFAVRTGSGGLHIYYFSDYSENHVLVNGEMRSNNYQVVGAGCTHPNGNKYEVVCDAPIKEISADELKAKWITPYMKPETPLTQFDDKAQTDESRSAKEFGEVCHLIRRGFTKELIFEKMMAFTKWANPHHPDYREHTYKKALQAVSGSLGSENQAARELILNDIAYYQNLKVDKKYIVRDFITPCSLNMWAAPPKSFKSMEALHLALCVAMGRDFYGLKTHKFPVLYIDLENPEADIKRRLLAIKLGMSIRKNPKMWYLSRKEYVDVYSAFFIRDMKETIKRHKIKFVILDTLRRMSPTLKENEADDVSKFYRLFFAPLRDELGVSVLFLHHMDKKAKSYRGSGDLQAMVDTSYTILKHMQSGDEIPLTIKKDVSRSASVESISGCVRFVGDAIEFESRAQQEKPQSDEYRELVKLIVQYMETHGRGVEVTRASINIFLETMGVDFKKRRSSITRILEYLRTNSKIDMSRKGRYIWL